VCASRALLVESWIPAFARNADLEVRFQIAPVVAPPPSRDEVAIHLPQSFGLREARELCVASTSPKDWGRWIDAKHRDGGGVSLRWSHRLYLMKGVAFATWS
jgi:hypothetical protein